jgi:metal-responsive CopG/Arc/MetJ family transcriptional regulator
MEGKPENKDELSRWLTIALPRALVARVEWIYEKKGYVSRADYIRAAIQKQLASDEVKE